MQRDIVLLPDRFTEGWAGGDLSTAQVHTRRTWAEFAAPHNTDVMACSYLIPGEEFQPRLRKEALPVLRSLGVEPELHWVFLDFDRTGHAPWPSLPAATLALFDALDAAPPGAGGYTTRAGIRLVWHLDPPLPCSLARSFLGPMQAHVAAAVAEAVDGLSIDEGSAQWHRVMRAPRACRDGVVLESASQEPGRSLDPYAFAAAQGWDLESDVEGTAATVDADLPAGPVDLTFDEWKAAWAYPYLKVGGPIPEEQGQTYPVVKRILAAVARAGEVSDPHTLASYIWASVENTPGRSMSEFWRLACWVAAQEANRQAAPDPVDQGPPLQPQPPAPEEWAVIRPFFRGNDRRLFERLHAGTRLSHQNERILEATHRAIRILAERAHIQQPRDLYAFLHRSVEAAAPQGPLPDDVWRIVTEAIDFATMGDDNEASRVLFIQDYPLTIKQVGKGGALFQLDTRATPYCYRITDPQALYLHFQEYTRPGLPFEADYPTTMTLAQVLTLYGRTVERVVYTSGQDGTVYDRASAFLSQGVHTLESVTPRFHADVDGYLRLLGGAEAEYLLDWCAALTYTASEPVAALYLHGWGDGGKTLFAVICASLWGSGFTDYNACQGNFNGALLNNPILLADEGIAVDNYNEAQASESFRRYVANSQHPINPKFGQPAELHGCPRVIVTANDLDGIPFKKALGREGIDAITQRVLYVHSDPGVKEYLTKLGARAGLRDWVQPNGMPGRAAEHLLWLRDNRKLQTGGRFLVTGRMSDWHRQFVASQGYKPSVLTVLAGVARAMESTRSDNVYIRLDTENNLVWAHHSTVYDMWGRHADVRRPKPSVVAETLDMLASGDKKQKNFGGTRKRCVPIPFEAFVDAKVLDWGDLGFSPRWPINDREDT